MRNLVVTDFAIVLKDSFVLTYDTGLALIRFEDLDKKTQSASAFFCDMEETKFFNVKEISYRRAVGLCSNPSDRNSNQFFEVSPISESFSINFNPNIQSYPSEGRTKILSSMGSVTYLANFSTVNLARDPFEDSYFKSVEFVFDFMIQDYTIIGSDKCVAVSRDGWIAVAYDNSYDTERHGMSFQIQLEPEEWVECIASDSSTNFICVATTVRQSASKLVFCEIIGDQEIFLVQSSNYLFSEGGDRPNLIADMSTDMSYCGESVLVVFESGPKGGVFTFTVNEGAQNVTKKSYLPAFFEEGFVNYATSDFTKIWTLDSGGTLKRISREYLLGIESEFKIVGSESRFNHTYPSDNEDETLAPYDWNNEH